MQHFAEPLLLKRFCIQDLIPAAGSGGERNEQIWFAKLKQFTDRVGTGTGYDDVRKCEQIGKLLFDIFILHIAWSIAQGSIQIAFAAEMHDLKGL